MRMSKPAATLKFLWLAMVLAGAAACGAPDVSVPAASPPPATSAVVAEPEPTASVPSPATSADTTETPKASVPSESVPDVSVAATPVPEATVPEAPVPATSVPEATVPTTSVAAATVPEVSMPTTSVETAPVPTTTVPATSVPAATAPEATVPTTSVAPGASVAATPVPEATAPDVSVPTTSVPTASVPTASVPTASVPTASIPSVSLPVVAEHDAGYDRDEWGPHNSSLCRGAVGSPDPYTGTPIDTCNVDHVVALHEAHESGGWAWPVSRKQRFSQAPDNHVASRACVNQSKGGDDIFEWSDADIARSSACGGGYSVTAAGRCLLARVTVAVKSSWDLAVDQAEADALSRTLSGCGDQAPGFSAEQPATTPPPTTTAAPPDECVISGRTAAQYEAVSGIGAVLSTRLVDAQPFSSRSDLQAVRGIGPVKAEAVWSHFCGR